MNVPAESRRAHRVLCVFGNPKEGGFVHECIEHIAARLAELGLEIERVRLNTCAIQHCRGCFNCLQSGICPIQDDMQAIIERVRGADGLVAGASVRNGLFPALFKQFYERITYPLGFTRELRGKHVLAVGAVGFAGGRRQLGRLLTFREFQSRVSGYLFFRTGIPTRIRLAETAVRLERAADKLHRAIETAAPLPLSQRIQGKIDDFLISRFMLRCDDSHTYDYLKEVWRGKGLL